MRCRKRRLRELNPRSQRWRTIRARRALKMKDREDTWRIRVGRYRVIYEIHDDVLVVVIIRVAHRRDAYR